MMKAVLYYLVAYTLKTRLSAYVRMNVFVRSENVCLSSIGKRRHSFLRPRVSRDFQKAQLH